MKTIKLIVLTLMVAVLLQGCTIKNSDSTFKKTLKHTANSPMYVVVGVGALAVAATVIAATATASVVSGTVNTISGKKVVDTKVDEKVVVKVDEKKL